MITIESAAEKSRWLSSLAILMGVSLSWVSANRRTAASARLGTSIRSSFFNPATSVSRPASDSREPSVATISTLPGLSTSSAPFKV